MNSCKVQETKSDKLYISAKGNDTSIGSEEHPLKSLKQAISLSKSNFDQYDSLTIILRAGRYVFPESLTIRNLNLEPGQHLTIKNYPGEEVIFTSSKAIQGWKKLDHQLEGLNEKANAEVWYADVPENTRFYTLYTSDQRLPRARSNGYLPTVKPGEEKNNHILHFPEGALREWENLEDVEVMVRPQHAWIVNILPLEKIDEQAKVAYTSIPATYPMTRMDWLYEKLPELFWVENVAEALNEPGEWILNSEEGRIYHWPLTRQPSEVYYPQSVEILRLEGEEGSPLRNITIEGITFTQADRYTWKADDIGLQHDWDMYNASTAMLRLINTENCQIRNCSFVNAGSGGIRFDFHSQANQLTANTFYDLGGTAILLSGYGPGTKDANKNNEIRDNLIHDCGEIYWHSPAIFVWQSGNNHISNNLIYNMPYNGICLSGVRPQYFDPKRTGRELRGTIRFEEVGKARDWDEVLPFLHTRNNDVSFNEIHHVMQKLGDGNGIYISGGGHGNVIRNNYIHDLTYHGVQGGIRTDDFQEGTTIKNNLIKDFYRKAISMKHTNKLINNVFIGLKDGVAFYGTPVPKEGFVTLGRGPLEQSEIINNVFFQDGGQVVFIKDSPDPPRGEPALIEDCIIQNNIFWAPGEPAWLKNQIQKLKDKGAPNPGIVANPGFILSDSSLYFHENSPVHEMNINPIKIPFNSQAIKFTYE